VKEQGSSLPCALSQRYVLIGGSVLALLCLLALFGTAGRAQAYPGVGDFVPGQVVVKLEPTGATIADINASYRSTTLETIPGSTGVYLLKLQAGSDLLAVVKTMVADPRLAFAEPNFLSQAPEGDARHRAWGVNAIGSSPEHYAAKSLGLADAHAISRGAGTTVAVLDTGAQLDHPALKANFANVARYDFVDRDNNPTDRRVGRDEDGDGYKDEMVGHGTHVAGIVDLVAPAAKIMPLRVLNTEGYGDVFAIAKAVSYAERNGADVVNLSLGTPSRSYLLKEVIDAAADKGVVTAAAAGNSNTTLPQYPAADTGVAATVDGLLAVTSVNQYEKKSGFANYGLWMDIAAPGEGIRSAFPVSVFASWSGTSMATPFVAGQAALVHAVDGSLSSAGVERRIRCSARPLDLKNPTHVGMLGAGHADARASLEPGACP
jgi:thermitase